MPSSKYKGISWRNRAKNPWQALVNGVYLGCFPSEADAAKAAESFQPGYTEFKGIAKDKDSVQVRAYRYISWHCRDKMWVVRIARKHHGTFRDHGSALAYVMNITGLTESALLLDPKDVRKSLRGQRDAVPNCLYWFRLLYSAYKTRKGERSIAGAAYPGDLEDLHCRAATGSTILQDPNFIVLMMLAKFGPHRDALQTAYSHNPKPKSVDNAMVCRWVYDVVVGALELLTAVSDAEMQPWIDGPGKQTTHHSGLTVYASTSLNILVPLEKANPLKRKYGRTSKQAKVMVFGKQKRSFVVQSYSTTIQRTLIKLQRFGQALLGSKPPKSLKEWAKAMEDLRANVRNAPGIPNSTCYRYSWVVRGFWDFQLRQAKIPPGISFTRSATVLNSNYLTQVCCFFVKLVFVK